MGLVDRGCQHRTRLQRLVLHRVAGGHTKDYVCSFVRSFVRSSAYFWVLRTFRDLKTSRIRSLSDSPRLVKLWSRSDIFLSVDCIWLVEQFLHISGQNVRQFDLKFDDRIYYCTPKV